MRHCGDRRHDLFEGRACLPALGVTCILRDFSQFSPGLIGRGSCRAFWPKSTQGIYLHPVLIDEGKKPVTLRRKCAEIKNALFPALEKAGMISRC